jgi:hypothetical protein
MKSSGEYQAIQNIINKTTEQLDAIKNNIENKNKQMLDL